MLNKKFKTIGWRFACVLVALVAFSQVAFAGLSGGEKFYLYLPNWAKDANAGISVTVDGVNATFTDGPSVGQDSGSGNWYYRCELTAPQNGGSTIMVYRYGPNNEGNWNLWKFSGINNEKIFDGTNASNGTDESSAETNCAKYEMNFYICGTPNNNDWDNYSAMTSLNGVSSIEYTATDSNVCYFAFKTGDNNGRNLKFRPTDTSNNAMITVGGGGVDLSVSTQSTTAFGFNTEANKTYVISIDHSTFEVSVVEKVTTVYLIGSIFNDNWDSTGVKMSLNENGIYTYSFSDISSDKWFRINVNGAEYGPATNDLVVNTDGTEYEYNGNVGSNSWKLSNLDSSKTYTVNVNTDTQKISVTEEGGNEDVVDTTWSKVEILGGIYNNNFEKGNGYELSVAEDGTYAYEFTYTDEYNNPWFIYYVTLSDGTGYYLSPKSDTDKYITTSAVNYCKATTSVESFNYVFEKGEKYIITLTPSASDKTSGTIDVKKVASETPTTEVLIVGNEQSGWNLSDGEVMTYDSSTDLYFYTIKKNSEKEWFSFFVDGVQYANTNGDMTVALDTEYTLTQDKDSKNGRYNFTTEEGYIYTIYVNLTKNNFYVKRVDDPNAIVGIPVYPIGVSSEAELQAYDFTANPVYYLCSPVLNDNRISPEWQMTKGSDGKYHLDGFAMRPTDKIATSGEEAVETIVSVATFSSYESDAETLVSIVFKDSSEQKDVIDKNPWYEGRLYNVTYDSSTNELTFELVEDEMPFISMVGYNFQQKENYETPRDSETNHGWQEAWILYDANGKIVKDRAGKVLYNTMWPPKNQLFFNAVRGSEAIELTSKNLTFTTDYVEMTGKEWKEQLQATSSQYNTLDLEDDKEYRRYVIENMWILGATKIWTGWGGQTADWGSQWNNHINWGYGDIEDNDKGSTITKNTTVNVVKNHKNFLFETPTYFRTVEFFYETENPADNSQFFTTLSLGDASIQAKATTDYEGSYKLAANNVPEGATITAYKVTRYEAATGMAIGVVADVKEQSLTQDGFNAIGWTDDTVLSNGKYYYVAEITFTDANGDVSTETVVSNPFTIYNATYENEVEAHQLLELTADGKAALNNTPATYITYNPAGFGALYLVNEDGSAATELTGDALTAAWSVLADDANYDWSTNVWLHSDVPADYAEAAENNAETGISLDNITNYNLFINGVESDNAPQTTDKSFSYVYDAEKIGQTNLYGLTMDYTQEISDENVSKVSAGGNANLTLVAPQAERATENEVTFGVEKVSAETTTEVKYVEGEATITDYYILKATFNFVAPNIDSDIDDAYDVVYVPTVKITNADGTVTTKVLDPTAETSVTVSELDPTATNIEFTVETRYYPQGTTDYENTSYAVGTYGDGVTIKSEMPTLGSEAAPSVDATVGISANADDNSKYDITVSNATATLLEANSFAGEALENVYYDFDVNNEDGDQVAGLQDGQVDENGVGDNLGTVMTGVDKPESVTVAATPVYVFKVGDEFVGLRGTTGTDLVEEGSYTGVESTFAGSVSVATGNGYIEVLGASEVNVYDIAGALIGGGDTRFEVVSGVYVVVADGKAMKVIVR